MEKRGLDAPPAPSDWAVPDSDRKMSAGMLPRARALIDMIMNPDDAFNRPAAELRPLQLAAAQEIFEQRVQQIPLLRKRAQDAGIDRIRSFEDIVPLLFAHTVYKSYPQQLVEKKRWKGMLQWLQTLSVANVMDVDVDGVENVDQWLDRLWAAGHVVVATSGSSGKCSFLNHTTQDRALKTRHVKYEQAWPFVRPVPGERPVFWLGPIVGRNSAVETGISNEEIWGTGPGSTHTLSQPLLISEVSKTAAMRKKIAEGTATPGEIADFEEEQAEKAAIASAEMLLLADKILDLRHQPLYIYGLWAQHMAIIRRARERGIGDGEFHPRTVVYGAGGVKGTALPSDYQKQVERFYGDVFHLAVYGMTEMAQLMPRCEARRYHTPPGVILLLLDKSGDALAAPKEGVTGLVEGRVGFLDLLYQGRWGGIISGDKVTIDYSEKCPCGRFGPSMLDSVSRYASVGEEDHIGCSGTIDAYIRGGLSQ